MLVKDLIKKLCSLDPDSEIILDDPEAPNGFRRLGRVVPGYWVDCNENFFTRKHEADFWTTRAQKAVLLNTRHPRSGRCQPGAGRWGAMKGNRPERPENASGDKYHYRPPRKRASGQQ